MSMKAQVNPIIPVAALVVATLAAGATMWHGLFVSGAGVAARGAARGAVAAPKAGADAPKPTLKDAGRDAAARQPPRSDRP